MPFDIILILRLVRDHNDRDRRAQGPRCLWRPWPRGSELSLASTWVASFAARLGSERWASSVGEDVELGNRSGGRPGGGEDVECDVLRRRIGADLSG